jgi:hypothetical protein
VVDLGEKATTMVLDPEHPSVNLHSRATLVKLAKVDDGVLEGQDVVDFMQHLVLVDLTHEHDGPDVADLHRRLVAELDEALDAAVQVSEVPDAPDHVVCGTTVEVPSLKLVVIEAVAEESLRAWLVDAEQGR